MGGRIGRREERRLSMTYQEVLATYKTGSVKKKKKIGSVTLTWLQTGYTK